MTTYEWDAGCADLELARLERGFTGYDHVNFARVLTQGALRVEADIHVESGRLRSSAHSTVERSGSFEWEGDISVGDGLPYAASEFFGYSPKHGGYPSHAFMRRVGWQPTPRFDGEWSQQPVGNVPSAQGVPIEDDMIGPVASFLSRGRNTPHPEGTIH